jgi:hypothetical protein
MEIPSKFGHPLRPTPCNRTYWVVDGLLLAGAYPGNPVSDNHRYRIEALFDAGMRTFINLQEVNEKTSPVSRLFAMTICFARSLENATKRLRTCAFQYQTEEPLPLTGCDAFWMPSIYRLLRIVPFMFIVSAAWGERERASVVGYCVMGLLRTKMFWAC